MIHAVVVCPGVPALLPGVAPTVRLQLDALVLAGRAALAALAGADRLVVLVEGMREPVPLPAGVLPRSGVARSDGRPVGAQLTEAAVPAAPVIPAGPAVPAAPVISAGPAVPAEPAAPALPVAAAVGAWWLSLAGPWPATTLRSPGPCPAERGTADAAWWGGREQVAVLAVVDGGIRHGEDAPGRAHPEADAHLAGLVGALASGDPAGLDAAITAAVADHDPPVAVPVWRALARLPRPDRAAVLYAGAPFGVGHVVARWSWPGGAVA